MTLFWQKAEACCCSPLNKCLLRNYKCNFRLPMSSIATVTRNNPLQLFTRIFHSISFSFPLLLLPVKVQNNICNSLLTILTTSLQNLNKIGRSELNKIWIYLTKPVYYAKQFWNIVSAILKEVLHVKQFMMLRVFIIRVPSFILPKITVVWHLKASLKLN